MARLARVDIPREKRGEVALTYIYGGGRTRALPTLKETGISGEIRGKDLNNTIVSITDPTGAVISWASSGGVGFKGSRKSTPYAAQLAAESAARQAQEHGMKKVDVFVKGPGSGRETAIRSLQAAGLEVGSINDVTPQADNGVRPRKRRRV